MDRKPSVFLCFAMFLMFAAGRNSTVYAQSGRFDEAIALFEKGDREQPPPSNAILFVGSSSIRMWQNMKKANDLINDYTAGKDGLEFIDVSTPMLGRNGQVRPELFIEDRLHMNADGYLLWTSIIKPRLEAMIISGTGNQ